MPITSTEGEHIINRLTDNLNVLVDDAQKLTDREKVISEKLRFAREQYQQLASKYAIEDSVVTSTLEQLDLALPSLVENDYHVSRDISERDTTSQSQLPAVVDDIRLAASQLTKLFNKLSEPTLSVKLASVTSDSVVAFSKPTSQTTELEEDLIEYGKKSDLNCPFSSQPQEPKPVNIKNYTKLRINVDPSLPIKNDLHLGNKDTIKCLEMCPGMKDLQNPTTINSKCPIRFLGQRSPEEVARYFETHKHEIPRSHEICLKRQQRNEDHIRKLDAKYGDLVSIIEALGQKHQPLLPDNENKLDTQRTLDERLEVWVRNVSYDESNHENEHKNYDDKIDKEQFSDRKLKEVRVGESPSRPWGISVPIDTTQKDSKRDSPPSRASIVHLAQPTGIISSKQENILDLSGEKKRGDIHSSQQPSIINDPTHYLEKEPVATSCPFHHTAKPKKSLHSKVSHVSQTQPNFIKTNNSLSTSSVQKPHMIFTGPVFFNYSTEEAIKIIQELEK